MQIIIIGGGITGASLALAISKLSKEQVQISLIEAIELNKKNMHFNNRTIALSYGTCQQFNQIGIWDGLKKYVTPITHIHISEYGHASILNIKAKYYSIPALGYVIKLSDAKNYLFDQIKKTPNITLFCPEKTIDIIRTINNVSVKLTTNKILTGQLLVAADGSNSIIRKISKIDWYKKSYEQCAITANILTSALPKGRAFERFTQFGSLAILPVSKYCSSLIWCYPLKNKQHIMQLDNDEFVMELQQYFGWRLGEIKLISKRYYLPLFLYQAKKIISHRLVLVGNAAQTVHPIGGQGFNLAMRDIMILADIISKTANNREDIGNYSVLINYQIKRNNDRQNIIKITDNLVRLFNNKHIIFIISRNIALIAMEILKPISNILIRKAIR
ncbi:2-octaprenyl-6-methoxyphenol hydroxylase [Candidatus Arsenophonus lipoptenae]|uniref:2-octaprenyl-6-methoxyphenol hydroxylase n=1 Tax=Candidatus Arsenophonus lipoptenae TaxID=634113 RepID=A0A109QB04_9GAMM|nr:2-octaprenyl-6-methoxyphenyl hydroxylase [Candidatus Arsenophonus lipoptenae]AMA64691.1 2-octaprenyl-6-methoxyphenol hydroxylase [Candidatus Arsenophonus lipoptenae]